MKDSILVINSGSSSLKFAILNDAGKKLVFEGIAEQLNSKTADITFKFEGTKVSYPLQQSSHQDALSHIKLWLDKHPLILDSLIGVGHRIVHGGETFTGSVIIDNHVIKQIENCIPLAPLHNPSGLKGIEACLKLFKTLPQIAVFDTSFHQTLNQVEYLYPIPMRYYRDHALRKYGFHGTSFRYISKRLGELDKASLQEDILVAHLGNGASACAISEAKSVDTSMGLTPLEGMMMGTRSGNVDPMLLSSIAKQDNLDLDATLAILNKESGLLGISELSNDCRTLEEAMNAGSQQAKLALDMFCERAAKNLVCVATSLTNIKHLVFTGGIGENSHYVREKICSYLRILNIHLDKVENETLSREKDVIISPAQYPIKIWIIPTNEELMIALDTIDLIQ